MPIYLIAGIFIVVATVFLITNTLSKVKESTGKLEQISRELLQRLQNLETKMESTEKTLNENLTAMRKEQREESRLSREEQTKGITSFGDVQSKRIKEIGDLQRESLDSFAKQLTDISRLNEEKLESVRDIIEKKLIELHKSNEEKLEKMRETVDEKLHSTLEKRLGEAFKNVSERLEQVHVGLGEMKALTSDVGDLKKVLSNVKVRGTWGEMQLKSLLDQILTEDQYKENVATRPKSTERVEFAICLPGADDNIKQIWLPIDSKFPMEDYQKLVTASEENDTKGIDEARKALRTRVISEAKDIKNKYIETPYTTDFGILYLPVEGLYAEVLRIDGLCEILSREYRVVPAGPTTITALLNSLQMGFRTLAIEKRSSDVWSLLAKVKTEFEKFGIVLEKTKSKIEQAGKELGNAEVRTRAISRALKKVQELPSDTSSSLDEELLEITETTTTEDEVDDENE